MTNDEIKREAKRILSKNSGNCASLMIFMFAVIAFILMCEITTYLVLKTIGWQWIFDITQFFANKTVMWYWIIKVIILSLLLMPEFFIIRRMFIDTIDGDSYINTRQFISAHSFKYYTNALYKSFIYYLIKFFTAVPGFICVYGVYYWGWVCKLDTLTSAGLFAFMMCLGCAVIWIGFYFHYCISISLTPYILSLNPRTNVFDACDLSVKLMDGQHYRYISFLMSFAKFLPALLLVYPFFVIYPYFKTSYIVFIQDIMGDYWQDKMPAIIKRWRKYL